MTENLGMNKRPGSTQKEPMWKRRLENQIKVLRSDLSRIEQMRKGKQIKEHHWRNLEWKYRFQERGLKYAPEDLKQRIRAKATKIIKRYEERNKQFRQNRLFESDQGKFFDELEGVGTSDEAPDQEETVGFWRCM